MREEKNKKRKHAQEKTRAKQNNGEEKTKNVAKKIF